MALTPDDVADLARLARIELTDDELAHLAPAAGRDLGVGGPVSDVAADDIPPTSHALPLTNVFRTTWSARPCRWPTCWPVPRPPSRTGSGCRGSWGGGMTER